MTPRWLLGVLALLFLSGPVHAAVRACAANELSSTLPQPGDDEIASHRRFELPHPIYDRPPAFPRGMGLRLLVGEDGKIICLDRPGWLEKWLRQTPQRRAIATALSSWTYAPFQVDGKPARVEVDETVVETVDFKFHEDMPSTPLFSNAVTLSRSGCLGSCPAYSVTIHGDGRVDYDGEAYTDVVGAHHYRISPGEAAALIERLRGRDVWSMSGEWSGLIYDAPGYDLTLKMGSQSRTIRHTDAGEFTSGDNLPAVVTDSEDDIDNVAHTGGLISLSEDGLAILDSEHYRFQSKAGAGLLMRTISDSNVSDDLVITLLDRGTPVEGGVGPDIRLPSSTDVKSALDAAVLANRRQVIQRLLDSGALLADGKPDQARIDGAFVQAILGGHLDVVQQFLAYHPSPTFAANYFTDNKETLAPTPMIMLLDRDGASDQDWSDDCAIARLLIDKGADPASTNADGKSLLAAAAQDNDACLIHLLLDSGADINAADKDGKTPLGWTYDEDAALLLLEAGADPTRQPDDDTSFFYFVQNYQWDQVIAWLKAHGYADQLAKNAPSDPK